MLEQGALVCAKSGRRGSGADLEGEHPMEGVGALGGVNLRRVVVDDDVGEACGRAPNCA